MAIKVFINNALRSLGFQISQYPDMDLRRRIKIIQNLNIDLMIDVGANAGQYGQLTRSLGYKNSIVSFEPIKHVFNNLQKVAANDNQWTAHNYALGEKDYATNINVSKNTYSSSILDISSKHVEAAPESAFVEKEQIEVRTLDSIYASISKGYQNPFLKIDVQGFEKNVLDGAASTLHLMKGVQLELSLSPLYQNETTFTNMLLFMESKGFELVSLENSLVDRGTAFLLQADGIFIKKGNQ